MADTTKKIKVKALTSLVRVGYAYMDGAVFQISEKLGNEWIKAKLVKKVK